MGSSIYVYLACTHGRKEWAEEIFEDIMEKSEIYYEQEIVRKNIMNRKHIIRQEDFGEKVMCILKQDLPRYSGLARNS